MCSVEYKRQRHMKMRAGWLAFFQKTLGSVFHCNCQTYTGQHVVTKITQNETRLHNFNQESMNHELQEENPPLEVEKGRIVNLDTVSSRNLNFGIKVLWSTGVSISSPDCLFRWLRANGAYFTCRKCTSHDTPWTLKLFRTPMVCLTSLSRELITQYTWRKQEQALIQKQDFTFQLLESDTYGTGFIVWQLLDALLQELPVARFCEAFATLMGRNCVEASLHQRKNPSHIWRRKYYRD